MGVSDSKYADSAKAWDTIFASKTLSVHHASRALLLLKHDVLFEAFLDSSANTYVVSVDTAFEIIDGALAKLKVDDKEASKDFREYLLKSPQLDALNGVVDILALCTAALLFNSSLSMDQKVVNLFQYMDISGFHQLSFEDYYLGLVSTCSGILFGLVTSDNIAIDEKYCHALALQWFKESCSAGPKTESVDALSLSFDDFNVYANNRHHSMYAMLELLGKVTVSDRPQAPAVEVILNTAEVELVAKSGDEWLANPAWKKTAEKMVSKDAKKVKALPGASLALSWVHGYRGYDCRNNLTYLDGEGIYASFHVAGLSIAQDTRKASRAQAYFTEHTNDIISIATHSFPDRGSALVATGEMGKVSSILLYAWSPKGAGGKFETLCALAGNHKRGVCQLAFSSDGQKLFSVGLEYSVTVFCTDQVDTQFGKVVGSSQGPKDKILHCASFGDKFISCGEKHILVWTSAGSAVMSDLVKLGSNKSKNFLTAASLSNGFCAVSTSDGDIFMLQGIAIFQQGSKDVVIKAHEKAANALWSSADGNTLVSGGAEGKIIVWKHVAGTLTQSKALEIAGYSMPAAPRLPPIRAVCMSADGKKLLVGTQFCEVLDLNSSSFLDAASAVEANLILSGHFKDELWGLDTCASRGEFCTVGDDGYLRIFSLESNAQVKFLDLDASARCCAYNLDGSVIAVGFAAGLSKSPKQKSGVVCLYSNKDALTQLIEIKDAKKDITDIKFSPDGRLLAVGSADNNIYVYTVNSDYKKKVKFNKHAATISHLDFTKDSKYLQSNCNAYELLFSDTATGNLVPATSPAIASADWATWTSTLGYATLGIWSGGMDGSDINAVCRSPDGKLLATADDFSKVRLFNFPCVVEGSPSNEYVGHSSHVTNLRWITSAKGDPYVVSTGGNDKAILVWHCIESGDPLVISSDTPGKGDILPEKKHGHVFEDIEPTQGDEFMAVKPWLGAIVAPSSYSAAPKDPSSLQEYGAAFAAYSSKFQELAGAASKSAIYPSVIATAQKVQELGAALCVVDDTSPDQTDEMDLDWVHGYRGFDCRNNIRYVSDDVLVYPAAALVVLYNSSTRSQRYFKSHTDDVIALSVHGKVSSCIIASAQAGNAGTVMVWEAATLKTLSSINTKQKNIVQVAFVNDGKLLVSFSQDSSVVAMDWKGGRIIANVKGDPGMTNGVAALSASTEGICFMSCGDKHIRYWTLNGAALSSTKVAVTAVKGGTAQNFLCIAESKGLFMIGCPDGNVYCAQSKGVKAIFKGCPGGGDKDGLTSIFADDSLNMLLFGFASGNVCVWNTSQLSDSIQVPSHVFTIAVDKLLEHPTAKQIQSIACKASPSGAALLIGTRGCDIIEVSYSKDPAYSYSSKDAVIINQGHCVEELWGLSVHPLLPLYCTSCDDRTLRVWDIALKKQIALIPLGGISRACSFEPKNGLFIAVGYGGKVGQGGNSKLVKEGTIRIYSTTAPYKMLVELTDPKKSISDVKFSPNGGTLAVGSHDTNIYIYDVAGDASSCLAKLRCKFSKHNAAIAHFDFSVDGKYLQSTCHAYELLFSETATGKQIVSAKELRDVKWATWTSTLGWPCQGIWEAGYSGYEINVVARSNTGNLLAVGDDFSKVKLYRYPTLAPETAKKVTLNGHSSHLTNLHWSAGDERLISIGGGDKCIFQWKHTIVGAVTESPVDDVGSAHALEFVVEQQEGSSLDEEPHGGDESGAVKPWLGAIRAPKVLPVLDASAPIESLALEWVHGYSSFKVGPSAIYADSQSILYPAASLAVRYDLSDPLSGKQAYCKGHDEDVISIAISPNRGILATGQVASKVFKGKAGVLIWSTRDCRLLQRIDSCHERGVSSLSFSPSGTLLLTVGADNNNTHTLFEDTGGHWSAVRKVGSCPSDKSPVLFSKWISTANPEASDYQIVSGGIVGIQFWKVEGATMSKKLGLFGSRKKSVVLNAANFNSKKGWRLAACTSVGEILLFKNREIVESIDAAHVGAIYALAETSDFKMLISGGKDGKIRVWSDALESIRSFDVAPLSVLNLGVCSIDLLADSKAASILVGTAGGDIIEYSKCDLSSGSQNVDAKIILSSHSQGELWGLAVNPADADIFATAGDDCSLRIWSKKGQVHKQLKCVSLDVPARSVAWSHSGNYIVIGNLGTSAPTKAGKAAPTKSRDAAVNNGGIQLFSCLFNSSGEVEVVKRLQGCESSAWICDIKFSPDDAILCLGSHDKTLYAYNVTAITQSTPDQVNWSDNARILKSTTFKFKKHSSAVLHFDFSRDGLWIQSNCQAYELLFSMSGEHETSPSRVADYNGPYDANCAEGKVWHTQTCVLGWAVQGIWPPGVDGSDINCIDRSSSGTLLATGDDNGEVKIFRNPCVERAKFKSFKGHSSHVTTVRWTLDDYLITTGGNDKCIFVWRKDQDRAKL